MSQRFSPVRKGMVGLAILSFFLVQMPFLTITSVVAVSTPEITYYHASSYQPDSHNGVDITWQYNSSTVFTGTVNTHLFWSRDKTNYISVLPDTVASRTYRAHVPAQDGSEDQRYDEGVGRLYWYVRLYIENYFADAEYLFSESNPNDEVYFVESSSGTTAVPLPSAEPEEDKLPLFNQEQLEALGESLEEFFDNPLLLVLTMAGAGIAIVMLTRPKTPTTRRKKKTMSFWKRLKGLFPIIVIITLIILLPLAEGTAQTNLAVITFDNSDEGFDSNNCRQNWADGKLDIYDINPNAVTFYDGLYISAALISQIVVQVSATQPSNYFSISFNGGTVRSPEREILLTESKYAFTVNATQGVVDILNFHWNSENNWQDDEITLNSIVVKGKAAGENTSDDVVYSTYYPDQLIGLKEDRLYFSFEFSFVLLIIFVLIAVSGLVLYFRPKSGGEK